MVRALGLILMAGLAGCSSLQQAGSPSPPTPVPSAWHAGGAAPATAGDPAALLQWWQRFDEPLLPPLVERALAVNTDIQAARARLAQARAQRDLAAAGRRMAWGGSGSARAGRSDGGPTTQQYALAVDASWEADLFGGAAAGVRAAEATARAGAATLAATRVAVAAEVALNLLQWRGTSARLAIAQRNLASQQQTLRIVQWRAEAGLVTRLDVEQARTAVEQTRAQVPALEAAAAQAVDALATLTVQPVAEVAAALAAAAVAEPPASPPGLALALPAEVLRQRPDVHAAEQQWLAAAARVEQADAGRLPSLTLGGTIGLNALHLGDLVNGSGVASLLASASVPLLDGGRVRAQVRAQEAARDEAEAQYRATLLTALQDVEDALVALDGTRRQLAALQAAATAARSAAVIAEQRYRSGLVDFQNVLQSQRTLLGVEDGVASTSTTLASQHVRLYKALGGGWMPGAEGEPRP